MTDRFSRYVPVVTGLVFALPTLLVRYLPMTDLPRHEAVVGILRHFGDPSFFAPGLYELNLGHPNQVFYALAWLASLVVPTDLACKLVVAGSLLTIFLGAGRLASHLKVTPWVVPLLAPTAIGWAFYWGLVSYLLGFALFLGVLVELDRFAARPTIRRGAMAMALMVLLHFTHESVMVIATIVSTVFGVGHGMRRLHVRLIPPAVGTLVFFVQRIIDLRAATPTFAASPSVQGTLARKVAAIPITLFGSHDAGATHALLALTGLALAFLAYARSRPSQAAPSPEPDGSRIHRHRYLIAALLLVAGYFAMPSAVSGGWTLVNNRFLPAAFALLVVALAPRAGTPRPLPALAIALAVAVLGVAAPQFAEAHRAYRDLDPVISRIEKGSAIAIVELEHGLSRRPTFSAGQGPARAIAVRGGRSLYSLARSPVSPVVYGSAFRWDESDVRTLQETTALRPAHDLERYRYVVLHAPDAALQRLLARALSPWAAPVVASGEWVLFESTILRVSAASPDAPLPVPAPESLRDILLREHPQLRTTGGGT